MSERPRIIIADRHEIVREGLANKLIEDCNAVIVGEAEDGYSTMKICRNASPDILLMDIALTRPDGMDTFVKLRSIQPDLKIILLASDASASDAFTALSQGAAGFMPKTAKGSDIVASVRAAACGFTYLPAQFLQEMVGLRRNVTRSGNVYGLTSREIEVLMACTGGANTKEVAAELSISTRTVETHRCAIYRKTACKDVKDLARIAESI